MGKLSGQAHVTPVQRVLGEEQAMHSSVSDFQFVPEGQVQAVQSEFIICAPGHCRLHWQVQRASLKE